MECDYNKFALLKLLNLIKTHTESTLFTWLIISKFLTFNQNQSYLIKIYN